MTMDPRLPQLFASINRSIWKRGENEQWERKIRKENKERSFLGFYFPSELLSLFPLVYFGGKLTNAPSSADYYSRVDNCLYIPTGYLNNFKLNIHSKNGGFDKDICRSVHP